MHLDAGCDGGSTAPAAAAKAQEQSLRGGCRNAAAAQPEPTVIDLEGGEAAHTEEGVEALLETDEEEGVEAVLVTDEEVVEVLDDEAEGNGGWQAPGAVEDRAGPSGAASQAEAATAVQSARAAVDLAPTTDEPKPSVPSSAGQGTEPAGEDGTARGVWWGEEPASAVRGDAVALLPPLAKRRRRDSGPTPASAPGAAGAPTAVDAGAHVFIGGSALKPQQQLPCAAAGTGRPQGPGSCAASEYSSGGEQRNAFKLPLAARSPSPSLHGTPLPQRRRRRWQELLGREPPHPGAGGSGRSSPEDGGRPPAPTSLAPGGNSPEAVALELCRSPGRFQVSGNMWGSPAEEPTGCEPALRSGGGGPRPAPVQPEREVAELRNSAAVGPAAGEAATAAGGGGHRPAPVQPAWPLASGAFPEAGPAAPPRPCAAPVGWAAACSDEPGGEAVPESDADVDHVSETDLDETSDSGADSAEQEPAGPAWAVPEGKQAATAAEAQSLETRAADGAAERFSAAGGRTCGMAGALHGGASSPGLGPGVVLHGELPKAGPTGGGVDGSEPKSGPWPQPTGAVLATGHPGVAQEAAWAAGPEGWVDPQPARVSGGEVEDGTLLAAVHNAAAGPGAEPSDAPAVRGLQAQPPATSSEQPQPQPPARTARLHPFFAPAGQRPGSGAKPGPGGGHDTAQGAGPSLGLGGATGGLAPPLQASPPGLQPPPVPLAVVKHAAVDGQYLVPDFVSPAEEAALAALLDDPAALPRWSGWETHAAATAQLTRGKRWGVLPDYHRRGVAPAVHPLPPLLQALAARMREAVPPLKGFRPNEANALDYRRSRGSWLRPHVDDRFMSGEIIVNLSLLGAATMTLRRDGKAGRAAGPEEARVLLPPRSLQVLSRSARWNYSHGIAVRDLRAERRISITFRHSALKPFERD
ncbi:hypothetical protein HYH03_016590 [Edaphochlamys debaryana]|uniref:Alpha-ketoglutarate-dependent dioxygenase AlkB-like domain-containing protein n=1 Tax=Edaphochlamys debaryana TaxID=47281 RepID=A0A835XHA0_9CHLO|nr:hypothetical protein HYH03_016590 [Edaphochlamys debaryana]|eukprot:KAG2484637.1 hypothetical protein HYH03_016590 [Edaphochlamys debaryana]